MDTDASATKEQPEKIRPPNPSRSQVGNAAVSYPSERKPGTPSFVSQLRRRWEMSTTTGAPMEPEDFPSIVAYSRGDKSEAPVPSHYSREEPKQVPDRVRILPPPKPPQMGRKAVGHRTEDRRHLDESLHIDLFGEIKCDLEKLGITEEKQDEAKCGDYLLAATSTVAVEQRGEQQATLHSISAYRKASDRDKRVVKRDDASFESSSMSSAQQQLPPNTIYLQSSRGAHSQANLKRLQEAISAQKQQMTQAQRALNFCRANETFRGSQQEVDAYRALLLATERRHAIQVELEQVMGMHAGGFAASSPALPTPCKVAPNYEPLRAVSISSICVSLTEEFFRQRRESRDRFFVLALIKIGESVIATPMACTNQATGSGEMELTERDDINLAGLPPDSSPLLELYGMKACSPIDVQGTQEKNKKQSKKNRSRVGSTTASFLAPTDQDVSAASADSGYSHHHRNERSVLQSRRPLPPLPMMRNEMPTATTNSGFQCLGSLYLKSDGQEKYALTQPLYPLDGDVWVKMSQSLYLRDDPLCYGGG